MMWLFRAFCDTRLSASNSNLRADLKVAESRLKAANANYQRANHALATAQLDAQTQQRTADQLLRAVKAAHHEQLAEKDAQLDRANAYVTELEEALRQRDEDHAQVSGQLQDAQERLQLIDRDEDMRDEIRAKRLSDGMGDDQ